MKKIEMSEKAYIIVSDLANVFRAQAERFSNSYDHPFQMVR